MKKQEPKLVPAYHPTPEQENNLEKAVQKARRWGEKAKQVTKVGKN